MELIIRSPFGLAVAAALVVVLAALSWQLQLGIERRVLVAAVRSAVQLSLLGLVLNSLFAQTNLWVILALTFVMLGVAGYEVRARQQRRFKGYAGYAIGTLSMFLKSITRPSPSASIPLSINIIQGSERYLGETAISVHCGSGRMRVVDFRLIHSHD